MRLRRWLAGAAVVATVAVAATFGVRALLGPGAPEPPSCLVGAPATGYALSPEQAADAATIAAVGLREGLPDHAVTVALAAALQESKLYNLPYGDRDSVGIFQQRPSQGWGSPADLVKPAYAAAAFYSHLRNVDGWQAMPVAVAAQEVQHSADGSAYAAWEEQARALARVLTGEVAAGIGCTFAAAPPSLPGALATATTLEWGTQGLPVAGSPRQRWAAAAWLVAHSYQYGIVAVTASGRRWTPTTGQWDRDGTATTTVRWTLSAPATPSPHG